MTKICIKLEILLEAEREALVQGDLERVAALMAEKEELIACLGSAGDQEEQLQHLRSKFSRNHALFDSALAGLRSVAARLGAFDAVSKGFNTYNAKGERLSIGAHDGSTLEKRA